MATGMTRPPPVGGESVMEPEDKEEPATQFFLEAFYKYLVDIIDWKDLLLYKYFEPDDRKRFRTIAKTSEQDAVDEMLHTILKTEAWPRRFRELIKLVEEAENEKALMILIGESIPDHKAQYQQLVQQHSMKYICENLEVLEILPCLLHHRVLIQKDVESVQAAVKNGGRWLGALDLVLRVHKRQSYWFQLLLVSLIQTKQEHIARKIDEKFTEGILKNYKEDSLDSYTPEGMTSLIKLDQDLDQTGVKRPHSDEDETELKQRVSAELGTMEHNISYTSVPDISVLNMSPNRPADSVSLFSQPELLLHSLEENISKPHVKISYMAEDTETPQRLQKKVTVESSKLSCMLGAGSSVNNLSPNKPEDNRSLPLQPTSVRRSLESSMEMPSLSFNSLLKDMDNMKGQSERTVEGATIGNNYDLSHHSGESSMEEFNNFNNELQETMLSTTSSEESSRHNNSLPAKTHVRSDFSEYQKLTKSKVPCSMPSGDIRSDNVDRDLKGFRDKKVSMEVEQGLNIMESLGADHEREEIEDKDISLRDYQQELAAPALQGMNVIIVAPTGSGKTRVAMKIIQVHIRKQQGHGIAKVIFLVNQVALANQQGEACRELLKKYSSKVITGESQKKRECLKDFIDKRDILVVTAQVLLDALVRKDVSSINRFSLIVFDECHHTHANHTFNQIMGMYMDLKFGKSDAVLPQIVGLTASVGVGKARNVEKAVDHIKCLMANLDAQVISTVQKNMGELREYVSLPEEETCKVPKRQEDRFGEAVTMLMNTIEKRICQSSLVKEIPEAPVLEKALKALAQKGSAQYTQWVSKLCKETSKLKSSEARRFLNSNRGHLEHYNNALIIYNDARMEDALAYLDSEMAKWKENAVMDDNENILFNAFKKLRNHPFPKCSNPKLEKLQEMIIKAYARDLENCRGIVFVKTRDLAPALVRWMKDTPGLRELRPIIFTGTNLAAVKGGMTKAEQDDALEYFRDGKHKLIVSVAEEGLDISKCNLVIRYDHVFNEIAMVQSRGRGRAEEKTGMAEKEELNVIGEIMMRKAIILLQEQIDTDPEKFRKELGKLQDEANSGRRLKSLGKGRKLLRTPGQFELRCVKCDQFICWSDSIKKIQDSHHVVVDENLRERVTFVPSATPRYQDETIQLVGKLICKTCGGNLGVICIHRTLEFPVLKIENFLVVDTNGRQSTYTRWKLVPFTVEALSNEDWRELVRTRQQNGDDP